MILELEFLCPRLKLNMLQTFEKDSPNKSHASNIFGLQIQPSFTGDLVTAIFHIHQVNRRSLILSTASTIQLRTKTSRHPRRQRVASGGFQTEPSKSQSVPETPLRSGIAGGRNLAPLPLVWFPAPLVKVLSSSSCWHSS